jgi:hypothetical protein
MIKTLFDFIIFKSNLTDFADISKLVDNYYSKIQQFSREFAELKNDINNIAYNTGLWILLFIIIDTIILITVVRYFSRKESYEKVNKISLFIAITMIIPGFIYGYSLYNRAYTKEYPILPYDRNIRPYADQSNNKLKKQKSKEIINQLSVDQYLERRNKSIRNIDNQVGELRQQGYRVIVKEDTIRGKTILFVSPPISNFALVGIWFGLQGFLFSLIICQAITFIIAWILPPSEQDNNEL